MLHPCQTDTPNRKEQQKINYDRHTTPRHFVKGDPVWVRNFHQGPRWCRAIVTEHLGNIMYKVQLEGQPDVILRRHASQLCTRIVPINVDTNNTDDSNESAIPVVNTPHPLRRSSRIRKPTYR